MIVVLDFAAARGVVIPTCVAAFTSKIQSMGGTIISTTRTAEGFDVSWLPAGADETLDPMIASFAGPVEETPIDAGLSELETVVATDPGAVVSVLPDVEAILFGSVATVDPAMAILTDGYARVAEEPLHVPGAPVVALAARMRAIRSVAAALSTLAASLVLMDAVDGLVDGVAQVASTAAHLV